jgi:phosphoribosylglycinamide formyltransferase 1
VYFWAAPDGSADVAAAPDGAVDAVAPSGVGVPAVPQGVDCVPADVADPSGALPAGVPDAEADGWLAAPDVETGSGFCAMASARGTVRSLKQYRHLIASSWISSAQYGHFFTAILQLLAVPEGLSLPSRATAVACASMSDRIAVLVSGSGTNLQALMDDPAIRPYLALVLSDRPGIRALDRADSAGIPTVVLEPGAFPDRETFDQAVLDLFQDRAIGVLVSAGYLRVLGKRVLDVYEGRWLNVHPALLPSFPGMRGVRDALAYGVRVTGVTVHLVDEGTDTGPIVLQEALEVRPDDDWDSLEPRIHAVEHRLLPRAVRALLDGRIEIDGRHVRIEEEP